MEGIQRGSSSAIDGRVASVRLDVNLGQGYGYGGRPRQAFSSEQDALAPVSQLEYRDCVK